MRRCSYALFLVEHDVLLRQKRDDLGNVATPHTLVWECQRCGRDVGETVLDVRPARRVTHVIVALERPRLFARK